MKPIVPTGPYPNSAKGTPPAWHARRQIESELVPGFMNPRRTATQIVTLAPHLVAAIGARPVLGEAISITAHEARDIIDRLRESAELCRAGRARWSDWTAKSWLANLCTRKRQHSDAISAARKLAAKLGTERAT